MSPGFAKKFLNVAVRNAPFEVQGSDLQITLDAETAEQS
jgi:hypothetical protein